MNETVVDPTRLERVAHAALTAVAPSELPALPATVETFVARDGRLPRSRTVEDRLGFGTAELVVALAPTVVMVANECLKTLTSEATKGASGAARRGLGRLLRRRRSADPDVAPQVEGAEEDRLAAVARARARAGGLSDDQVEAIVDAVVRAIRDSAP